MMNEQVGGQSDDIGIQDRLQAEKNSGKSNEIFQGSGIEGNDRVGGQVNCPGGHLWPTPQI